MYVVFAGLTGRCGAFEFIGGSAVYDPEGRPVARLGDEEGLAIADLDLALVAQTRATHTMCSDHRVIAGSAAPGLVLDQPRFPPSRFTASRIDASRSPAAGLIRIGSPGA